MGNLRRLELACRGLITQAIAAAPTGSSDGGVADPTKYILIAVTAKSPANNLLPPEGRVPLGSIGVSFAERSSVSTIVSTAVGKDVGEQISRPHPCGHWWVLLSTETTSRFCCTSCDLKIQNAAN